MLNYTKYTILYHDKYRTCPLIFHLPSPDVFSGPFATPQEDGFSSLRLHRFMRLNSSTAQQLNTFHNRRKMAKDQKEQMRKMDENGAMFRKSWQPCSPIWVVDLPVTLERNETRWGGGLLVLNFRDEHCTTLASIYLCLTLLHARVCVYARSMVTTYEVFKSGLHKAK